MKQGETFSTLKETVLFVFGLFSYLLCSAGMGTNAQREQNVCFTLLFILYVTLEYTSS